MFVQHCFENGNMKLWFVLRSKLTCFVKYIVVTIGLKMDVTLVLGDPSCFRILRI